MSRLLINLLDYALPTLAIRWQQRTGINDHRYFSNLQYPFLLLLAVTLFSLYQAIWYMNLIGLLLLTLPCAYCANREDTDVNFQASQIKVLIAAVALSLNFDHSVTRSLILILMLRIISSDEVADFIITNTQPIIFLKSGKILPKHMIRKNLIYAFADEAVKNRCGWVAIFEYPDLARKYLNTREDGRMTSHLLKSLVEAGLLTAVINDKLYLGGDDNFSLMIEVTDQHLKQVEIIPEEITDEWTAQESFGVVLPKFRPPAVKRLAVRETMIKECENLAKIRAQDGSDGRIAECAHLAAREELDILNEMASKPLMDNLTPSQISNQYMTNTGWHVYNMVQKRWIGKPKGKDGLNAADKTGPYKRPDDPNIPDTDTDENRPWSFEDYSLAWTGNDFVCVKWEGKHATKVWTPEQKLVKPNYLLVIDKLKYRRGAAYLNAAKLLIGKRHVCKVILEEGVPSCGKTHNIVTRATPRDLITLPGREGAKEYLQLGKRAITIDSIIVNGWTGKNPQTLWIDEGLLTHCGAIEMAIQLLKPEIVRVFGDRRQIPFYPRVANYKMKHKEYPWADEPVYHNRAWSNPKVVCDMLRPLYPNGYVWSNKVEGYMDVIHATNPSGVRSNHDVYLTYRQDEKERLKKVLPAGSNIMTIHESQGLRFKNVALVRLKINDLDIYKSTPHQIVAVSRSSNSFIYYTCKPDDVLAKWIGKRGKPGMLQEKSNLFTGCKYEIKGGSYTLSQKVVVKLMKHKPSEGYEEWRSMVKRIIPVSQTTSLPFIMEKVDKRNIKWSKTKVPMPSVDRIQVAYDGMFKRRNLDIAEGDRMLWPIKWFPNVRINFGKVGKVPQLKPRPSIHPKLVTTQAPRAMKHPLDVKEAMEKRVVAPPKQQLGYTPELTDKLVEAFMKSVDIKSMKELNVKIRADTSELNVTWWNGKDGRRKNGILAANPVRMNGSKYFCSPRPDHKVRTDNSHPDTVEPGQLVSAHNIFWTSLFAPYFQVLLTKILGCMKKHIVLHTRLTWEELSDIIDNRLSGKMFQALELDISKFDKSQLRSVLEAQCRIMKIFGVPDDIVNIWQNFHEMCILEAAVDGVSFKVAYQRRSGDSLTWLGNTIVLIMIMGYLYDLEKTSLTLLSGDDNLACFDLDYKLTDQSRKAAEELNFEIKTFCFKNTMYFSSRFILCTRHGWIVVADPIKVISRLGRSDIQGREHLKQIHDSFKALHYMYSDPEVRLLLDEAVTTRYNSILTTNHKSMMIFIETITAIIDDYQYLEDLFFGNEDEWNLKLDPNERVGEGQYKDPLPIFEEIEVT